MKKFDGKNMSRKMGSFTKEALTFSGEALGIAALKLGREDIAYRAITGFRKAGAISGEKVEQLLVQSVDAFEKKAGEVDFMEMRTKAERLLEETLEQAKQFDPSKVRDAMREQADRLVVKETRIYGDSKHFHAPKDQVLPEGGHIILEELPFADPPDGEETLG